MITKNIRYVLRGIKYRFSANGYSESGEDLIARYLLSKDYGTYVDVGAGHPVVGSNTYGFYRKGWRGVAIDANQSFQKAWELLRPRDTFLNVVVGLEDEPVEFYLLKNDLRSTANIEVRNYYDSIQATYQTVSVNQKSLNYIFESFIDNNKEVFLSIDVEGSEYEVLKSLNLNEHKPGVIAIESWKLPWQSKDPAIEYLETHDYRLIAYSGLTAFYMPKQVVDKILDNRPKI